jgi:hypothetical protein
MLKEDKYVMVIKGDLARKLLKMGYVIGDLKPKKNPDQSYDYTRSVFMFNKAPGLEEAIEKLK